MRIFNISGGRTSAYMLHKVLQVAMEKDALNDWGSVVALTYIAAQRIFNLTQSTF